MLKRFLAIFLFVATAILAPEKVQGQVVFTFECVCAQQADTLCDICPTTNVKSRSFHGLLIRRYNKVYKWIDAPYTIRQINSQTVQFLEQIPSPESVQINLSQTPFSTMAGYLDSTNCQCNCGGANYVAGPGIVISGDTISAVDTSYTNELQRIDTFSIVSGVLRASLLNDGVPFSSVQLPVWNLIAGTGIGVSNSSGAWTISNTGDLSATNEGVLGVGAGGASSSTLLSNTSGANPVTINVAGSLSVSESTSSNGGSVTITGTDTDAQTLSLVGQTLSISGGNSVTLPVVGISAGTGISVSSTAGVYTITNSAPDQTVSITGAGISVVTGTYPNFTITSTEVDGSTTNELQTLSVATNTVTLSNSGGSFTIAGAGINTVSTAGSTITVTGTEVDGSITNEGILGVGAGGASSSTLLTNTSTGNAVTINAAGIISISETTSSNGGSITLTATEVDGSVTNEAQTLSVSGTTSGILTLSTAGGAGGGTATIAAGTGISVAQSGGTITIASTSSGTPWLLGGNTTGGANTIGSNDNFNVGVETNGTTRMVVANTGQVTIGSTALTTYALNINGLQGGGGIFIDGGSGLVGPTFLSTRGNGSGSTTYVIDAQHQMISGNVGAFIQNTATTGTGSAIFSAIVNSGATGDAVYYAGVSGGNGWYFGADNSATGDPFRITNGSSLGAISTGLSILSTGFTGVNNLTPTVELEVTGTGAIGMPVGTVAQRPSLTGEAPLLRYCNEGGMFELGDPNKNAWFRLAALTAPTVAVGAAAGTGGTAAVTSGAGSNDCSGSLTITTGTGTATGTLCTVTYNQAYSGTTSTVLLDAGNDLATTQKTRYSCQASNQTQFSIRAVTALDASQTYIIKYYVRNY